MEEEREAVRQKLREKYNLEKQYSIEEPLEESDSDSESEEEEEEEEENIDEEKVKQEERMERLASELASISVPTTFNIYFRENGHPPLLIGYGSLLDVLVGVFHPSEDQGLGQQYEVRDKTSSDSISTS